MKNNYHKAYDNKKEAPVVNIKQEGLGIDDVVETEVTEQGVVEKTVADFIEEPISAPVKEKKEKVVKTPFMVEVIGDLNLNVRKKPMGDIFTSVAPGAQAKVLEISEDGEWYFIESPKGFIMKKFTKKVK